MRFVIRVAAMVAIFVVSSVAQGSTRPDADATGSPYFRVSADGTERFPLSSTEADVDIAGTIANVQVTQTYKNMGNKTIEAVYVFPGSTRAAVTAMKMTIGKRTITAKVQRRADARTTYEVAKSEGKTASLLEEERPNVFTMNVANILPGDTVTVSLQYVETLVPTDGVYEFVYPTVVGPRYSGEDSSPSSWLANPTIPGVPPYRWGLSADIRSAVPIRDLRSTSHNVRAAFSTTHAASIRTQEAGGGDRDFVLQYRLTDEKLQTGLLLYPGAEAGSEQFFMAMVQPPKRVTKKDLPGREYIFILDTSGSMGGFPLETSKSLMNKVLGGLSPTDRFNLLMFAGGSDVWRPKSAKATKENITNALSAFGRMRGGGGTNLLGAMRSALAMPRSENLATTFVIVTDGFVSVESAAFDLIRDNLGTANLFAFGIGQSVNRHLIEGLARAGMGEPFVVSAQSESAEVASKFAKYISSPVLTGVTVSIDGLDAYDIMPTSVPDVFADRPVVVYGKYRGTPKGSITVKGTGGSGAFAKTLNVRTDGQLSKQNNALRYLWARNKVAELEDRKRISRDADDKAIEDLGIRYQLLTSLTSFVAVDSEKRAKGNKHGATVRQPLPTPSGTNPQHFSSSNGILAQKGSGDVYGGLVGQSAGWGYGIGGGGAGWGTIGLGKSGTIGHGSGSAQNRRSGARLPRVTLGSTKVSGGLAPAIARRYLRRMLPRIRHCYEQELLLASGLKGSAHATLVIAPSGRVETARVRGLGKASMHTCIEQTLLKIVFPKTQGGGKQMLRIPISFSQTPPAPKARR